MVVNEISIEEYAIIKLRQIEEDFEKFVSFLLPYNDNLKAFSPQFSSLIMDICSNIETIFRETIKSNIYDDIDEIQDVRDNTEPNMGDYRKIFEKKYNLSTKNVYFFSHYIEDVLGHKFHFDYVPFSKWIENKAPEWWKIYRNLKHSQFEQLKEANLKTVIDTYAAFFLICNQELNIRLRLVEYDYVFGRKRKKVLMEILKQEEPFKLGIVADPIYSKNKHFGYIFQVKDKPPYTPERVFSPNSIYR